MSPEATNERPLPVVPDHEMMRRIGRGSYGEVWLARNIMGIYRAVKVVYRDRFECDRPFEREFDGIRSFEPVSRSHECQVDILHVGRQSGYFFYVMELADDASDTAVTAGEQNFEPESYRPKTLQEVLRRRGRLPADLCLQIALDLTTALAHLHKHGLIHRDVKPSNIIFVNDVPKLADIGLVTETDSTLSWVGTEGFLPPEGPGTPAADLFALGKVIYEMSTGRDRMDFPELPTHLREESDRDAFVELNEVTLRACDADATRRYVDAEQMHQDLLMLRAGKSLRRTRRLERHLAFASRLSAVVLVAATLLLGAYLYQQKQTERARRLAQQNEALAEQEIEQRRRAEAAVRLQEYQRIDQLLESDQGDRGLALLAHRLRQDPLDVFAQRRLLSALTYRDFHLPLAKFQHEAPVTAAGLSSDGRYFATGTSAGELILWDLRSKKETARRSVGTRIRNIQFSPDSRRWLVSMGDAMVAQVLSAEASPKIMLELRHASPVTHAEFSPDGKTIVTTTDDRALVWDADSGQQRLVLRHGEPRIRVARFTADGQTIITSSPHTLYAWDSRDGQLSHTHTEPRYWKDGLTRRWKEPFALHPTQPWLAYHQAYYQTFLSLWNFESGEMIRSDETPVTPVGCVAFSPDGNWVASGSNGQLVRLWSLSPRLNLRHEFEARSEVFAVAFSPNAQLLAVGTSEGYIDLWNTQSGHRYGQPIRSGDRVKHLWFTPDGRSLLSCGQQAVWIWDLRPGTAIPRHLVDSPNGAWRGLVSQVHFSTDGDDLIAVGSEITAGGNLVKLVRGVRWPAWPSRVFHEWISPKPAPMELLGVRHLSQDKALALCWDGKQWFVVRTFTGQKVREFAALPPHVSGAGDGSISPDGHWVVLATAPNRMDAWNLWNNESPVSLFHTNARITTMTFNSTSDTLLTLAKDGAATLWSLPSGKAVAVLDPEYYWVGGRPTPDGRLFLLGSRSGSRLYNAANGEAASAMLKFSFYTRSPFSPDGQHFLGNVGQRGIGVWEMSTGRKPARDASHEWIVGAAAWHPHGDEFGTVSWDKTARIWDRNTGLALSEPLLHSDAAISLSFHPKDHWLATGSADGIARIWEIPRSSEAAPPWLPDLAETVCGYRLTESGNFTPGFASLDPAAARQKFHTAHASDDHSDYYSKWGRWFFGDRDVRPISPSATVSTDDHLRHLTAIDSPGWNALDEERLFYEPMNPQFLARLGYKLVVHPDGNWVPNLKRAEWLTSLAIDLDPNSAMAWWARAEVLHAADKPNDAKLALEKARMLDSSNPNVFWVQAWMLHSNGEKELAYEAFHQAMRLARVRRATSEGQEPEYLVPLLSMATSSTWGDQARLPYWQSYADREMTSDRVRVMVGWMQRMAEND